MISQRYGVHTDARAAESAQAVNARAFTVGNDLVFGTSEYAPRSKPGRWLLAHELTHTIQQTGGQRATMPGIQRASGNRATGELTAQRPPVGPDFQISGIPIVSPSIQCKATISTPGDRYEREADDVADRVMKMTELGLIGSASSAIQRTCAKCEENTANLPPDPATHSTHDSSQEPLVSGDAVLGTALIGGGGTDELHKQLVDDYTKDTGVENQPGLQYTKDYADWLQQQGGKNPPPGGKNPPPAPCQISVQYANPKQLDCDTIWKMNKGTDPPEPLCGGGLVYDIVSVSASGSGCPNLTGLKVSEMVTGDQGCTPPGFVWPPPKPCLIGPGGKLTGCTDSYTLCGPTRNLQGNGCTEVLQQDVLVGGKVAEKHEITFDLKKTPAGCKGKVTRK